MMHLDDVLENEVVRLLPLRAKHAAGLLAAATEDRWTYAFTRVPGDANAMRDYVAQALEGARAQTEAPYAVVRQDTGALVGATRFLELERWPLPDDTVPRRTPSVCEIGSTWYAASAQRTAINTATKLAMLTQAFEVWAAARVSLQTDARNLRSRTAIERIGGRFEGIRRAHKPGVDGALRDSAQFSIIAPEWPEVKAALVARLSR
jgi:RimJ/RimL family protein N-acetyltransferase